jgi:hypothetical protein
MPSPHPGGTSTQGHDVERSHGTLRSAQENLWSNTNLMCPGHLQAMLSPCCSRYSG